MAEFTSFTDVDFAQLDPTFYSDFYIDDQLLDDVFLNIYGQTYEDVWVIQGTGQFADLGLYVLGSGLTINGGGTVQAIVEGEWAGEDYWVLQGISLKFSDVIDAIFFGSPENTEALLTEAFFADDVFDLSNFGNAVDGGFGNDTFFGGLSPDTMFGGAGDDIFNASAGDYIDGGGDIDTVTFESAGSGAIVDLANPFANAGSAADSFLFSIELLKGSAFADEFSAGSDPVTMYGGAGDDVLSGSSFKDRIEGQDGSDSIIGGEGGDLLIGDGAEYAEFLEYISNIA